MFPTASERSYVYLSVDLKTNEVLDSVPFVNMSFTETKNGINTFRCTPPLTTEGYPSDNNKITRSLLLPGARKIVVVRDGLPVANNILWGADVSSVEDNRFTLSGQGHWSYLAARRIRSALSFSGDQFAAVDAIVAHAQDDPDRDVGLTVTHPGVSGVTRDIKPVVEERRSYREIVDEMANTSDGFDYIEEAGGSERDGFETTLRLANSLNYVRPYVAVELGRNARALSYREDAYGMENVVDIASQSKTGETVLFGTATDTSVLSTYMQMDGYARVDTPPTGAAALLSTTANERLASRSSITRSLKVELETGIGAGSGVSATYVNTHIGSIFRIAADYGWLEFDEDFIVEGRTVSINSEGLETITLDVTNKF